MVKVTGKCKGGDMIQFQVGKHIIVTATGSDHCQYRFTSINQLQPNRREFMH